MISTVILYILYALVYILTAPFRLFSDVSTQGWLSQTITTANGYIGIGYQWLPNMLNALLLTWGIYITIEVAIFLYKGIMWVLKKIPFIN